MTQHSEITEDVIKELEDFVGWLRAKLVRKYPLCPVKDIESIIDYVLEDSRAWDWD